MDKDAVLRYLQKLFADFEVHDELPLELAAIISASGLEPRFFKTLFMQLQILSQSGALASRRSDFEVVGKGIFSMKQKSSEYNIRILYSFLPNRDPVLLCAFYERGGKSKTDYTPYMPVALRRLKQYKEEL